MSRLNRILADDSILKQAVESPDRQQHEKDFSTLAFAFLQDRATGLLPYLLGFEVVDRDEDGAKAVGIFGFNISGHYYYVPSFFINSQIKGMDLLFSKTTNNFMPLQEEWIDKIINKSNVRLGGPIDADKVQSDFESPDLTDMIEPPIGNKSASVRPTADLAAHFGHDAWNAMQKSAAASLASDARFQEAFAGAVAAMQGKSLEKSASTDIVPFISNAGGPKAKEAFLRSLQNIKYANAFFEFYKEIAPFNVTKYAEELAPLDTKPDLRVTVDVKDVNAELDGEDTKGREKARLITDGFAIIDKRKDNEKTLVYRSDMSGTISVPSEPGVYDVWRGDNQFRKTYVFSLLNGSYEGDSIFIDPGTRRYKISDSGSALVSKSHDVDFESISKPIGSIRGDSRYFIFNPSNGKGFAVRTNLRRSGKLGHIFDVSDISGLRTDSESGSAKGTSTPSESFAPVFPDRDGCYGCCDEAVSFYSGQLSISRLPLKGVIVSGRGITVPSNFRVIELKNDRQDWSNNHFELGGIASLDEHLVETGFERLSVESDGVDFAVRINDKVDDRLSKKEACLKLVMEHGLPVPDADELIARAEVGNYEPVICKKAQLAGVAMPMPVPPGPGTDTVSGMGLPMEEPFIANQEGSLYGVPSTQDPTQPGFAVGGQSEMEAGNGGGVLSEDVMQLADEAAQSGQKHVFDQSTIAGLAGLYDIGYAIDMYVPELVKSLDRIGRILFIFYWKNDEFAERYGEQDLAGIEDLLRNVFKSFGTLVLHLQEKSVADNPREAT